MFFRKKEKAAFIPFRPQELKMILGKLFNKPASDVKLTDYAVDDIAEYIVTALCSRHW